MSESPNLAATLRARAALHPDRIAIIDTDRHGRDRAWSYSRLADTAARVASGLQARGLRPGDGVLVLQPMSGELYAFLIGAWQAGLVCLFIDPSQGRAHLSACVQRWRPRALFGVAKAHWFSFAVSGLRRGLARIRTDGWAPGCVSWEQLVAAEPSAEIAPGDAATPALVTFTSGSTGTPKTIVRTHGFLHAQHAAIAEAIALRDGEVDLTALPIFLIANLGSGLTSVIPAGDVAKPGAIDPVPVAAQIARHGITRGGASPAFWLRFASAPAGHEALARLRTIYTGGGPLWADDLAKLRAVAPDTRLVCVYGSTEAEPIAEIDADESLAAPEAARLLPAGHVRPEIRCAVLRDRWGQPRASLDAAGFDAERLPAGEVGEIVVSGEHVVSGYLGGLGDEETKFRVDGTVWHRTGDAGLFDAEGRLWFAGRCAARVNVEGRVLYPAEFEVPLRGLAGLRRTATLEVAGQARLAIETDDARLVETVTARLAAQDLPAPRIHVLKRLPLDKRHNAKIDYAALRRLLEKS